MRMPRAGSDPARVAHGERPSLPGRAARALADLLLSLSGALLLTAHLASDLYLPLAYIGLVPWVWLYGIRARRASWFAFVVGAGTYWTIYHAFLANYTWWTPLLAVVLFGVPYLTFPMLLRAARWLRIPWVVTVPVAWVATEFVFAHLALGRVADALLGYSQAPVLSLIQVADLGGVYAVSFVVAMMSGAIADVIAARAHTPRRLWRSPARLSVAAAVMTLVAANAYGIWRLGVLRTEPGPRVGVVQPAVDHTGHNTFSVYGPTVYMTAQAWDSVGKVDLIVWPENAIQDYLDRFAVYERDLMWLAQRAGAPVLVGSYGRHPDAPTVSTNMVVLAGPDGFTGERYDKIRLMPWMEYVPFTPLLTAITPDLAKYHARFAAKVVGYTTTGSSTYKGERVTVFRWPGLPPFASLICFETMDPSLGREAARNGARMLVNPTSEGRVGTRLQLQMLRISALRAVETRLPVVRAGNMGISAYVLPDGRLQHVVRGLRTNAVVFEPAYGVQRVRLTAPGQSPYVRIGDAFALTMLALALAGLGWSFTRRRG